MTSGSVETSRFLGMLVEASFGEKGCLWFLRGRVGLIGPFRFSPVLVHMGFCSGGEEQLCFGRPEPVLFMCLKFEFRISESSSCVA